MIIKKELIEKLISFAHSESQLLLMDTNSTSGVVKVLLKVFINEIKDTQRIAFISSHENFFTEVFSNTQISIKKEIDYILSNHRLSFHILTNNLIKTPPTNIDIFIVYPIETLDEKTLVKFVDKSKHNRRIILISDDSEKKFKSIKKLKPTFITLKEDIQTTYYNKIKNSINNSK